MIQNHDGVALPFPYFWDPFSIFVRPCSAAVSLEVPGSLFGSISVVLGTFVARFGRVVISLMLTCLLELAYLNIFDFIIC